VIENCAVVWPCGMVTVAGTVAIFISLETAIVVPPLGAGILIDTVAVMVSPPWEVSEDKVRSERIGTVGDDGMTTNCLVIALVLCWAVILTIVFEETLVVVISNVPLVWPSGIMRGVGTLAVTLSLERAIVVPPVGAGAIKVTVPLPFEPPITISGFKDKPDNKDPGVGNAIFPSLRLPLAKSNTRKGPFRS